MIKFESTHTDFRDERVCETIQLISYEDASLPEVMQSFRRFLLAVGFHPESVEKHIESD